MQYFLDSAKIDEIIYADKNWGIDGVTTNPRHIRNSGKPFMTVIKEIADYFKDRPDFTISVEINPHIKDAEEMVKKGMEYAKISKNFVIKIPCTEQGLIAARKLEMQGIRTNVTLVFSVSQAIAAAKMGAFIVSPFVGWKESSGEDCVQYIRDIVNIYRTYNFKTKIIVAALRTGKHIADAAKAGADIVTCGFQVYKDSFYHPFTNHGLGIFTDAWDNTDTTGA